MAVLSIHIKKHLTVKKKVMWLVVMEFGYPTTQTVIFESAQISILRTAICRKTPRAGQIWSQMKKLFFLQIQETRPVYGLIADP